MARNDLAVTGRAGVTATLEALARETDPNRRAAIATAAAQMNPLVVGPLLAMLETSDPALHSIVAELLRQLSVPQAIPLLPQNAHLAARMLKADLDSYRRGTHPFAIDEANQVELWRWNDTTKKLTATSYPAEEARVLWMARLARDLARNSPNDPASMREAVLLGLEAAAIENRPESSALKQLQSSGVALQNEILAEAIASNYAHAAVAAANALGQSRDTGLLYSPDSQPSPLANALRHSNRAVRFAALRAIMTLDSPSPYPGSSRVTEALAWFAAGTGERRALVSMPTAVAATDLANMLAGAGLNATAVESGRESVDLARETPDLEMLFVDVNINGPGIRQVIYELRISPTTAEVPIAILAPNSRLAAAEQLAEEHDRVIAAPRIRSPEVLDRMVQRLVNASGRFASNPQTRTAEATQALTWLSALATGHRPFYKIRRTEPVVEAALYGSTATPAIATLAKLGTRKSQAALANFVSQSSLSAEARSQAAEAFRESVSAHGLLLTTSEILAQYDRYNASERADAETQRVLGALLDTIESRQGIAIELPLPPLPQP